ncbi:DUF6867 family protein [Methylopila musalis]|uniref:DUF6867 family protein n=1 Tax=Methylopila musalis TaxID=1134781 RepID=A0ABW3Z9H4_9HYPH
MGLIWEISLAEFLFVTGVLGGGAAWMAGRAIATSWEPAWKAALWMLPLAGAVRFIHYALFSGSLLTAQFFLVDLAILVVLALAGHRTRMAAQMTRQYDWIFERAGPFGWRKKSGA